ncbi:aminotransferase class I/II-fold pyridoxal phosphate-dependent enzyme [Legionella septentrionalis]|uniref:aminotransferase class I/II-fold pyridoxal phosphate-dependent enzyme n=1 Tax=Legionella septentrionalis TaxID=2498109 RepID=UPI000F8D8398|nr:aminotransferase class I/II-fold pyridoxal phosphate-dependent enzyme [Legionella septentrionalis]RUR16134.1 aminotransferase class I/II-fold pyridoxal phosphate-dependent enzyme [Legionella septentrionalis]
MLLDKLQQVTNALKGQGLLRRRQVSDESLLNFSSNDYLSLRSHPKIKKAYEKGARHYPTGSAGSMVVCGYHAIHKELEQTLASALEVDDCLLFASGYAANLSTAFLLANLKIPIVIDKSVHASIYDGLKLAGAPYQRYLHNNLSDLRAKTSALSESAVVITESIFSMSGQITPLAAMARELQNSAPVLLVDEAHGFGILGKEGLGGVHEQHLSQGQVPLRVIPFGKACAAAGAVVAGQKLWIEALLQYARPYIYSTGMSPAFAYGLLETVDIVRKADARRQKLSGLIAYFRETIRHSPLNWQISYSPIQQLRLGCPHQALQCAEMLRQQGIVCLPMREPTVCKQQTGLRVILNYAHEPEHIDFLLECLHRS